LYRFFVCSLTLDLGKPFLFQHRAKCYHVVHVPIPVPPDDVLAIVQPIFQRLAPGCAELIGWVKDDLNWIFSFTTTSSTQARSAPHLQWQVRLAMDEAVQHIRRKGGANDVWSRHA